MLTSMIFKLFELLLLAWLIGLSLAFYFCRTRFNKLGIRSLSGSSTIEIKLQKSPSRLTGLDLFILSLSILCKYVPGTKGFSQPLKPFKAAAAAGKQTQSFDLPLIQVNGPLRFDQSDFDRFQRALQPDQRKSSRNIGDQSEQFDGQANTLFLVALTSPLVIYILSLHACPIKPLGAVNTRNTFKNHDPKINGNLTSLFRLSNEGKLIISAQFGGPNNLGKRIKRGMEFCITIEIRNHEEILFSQELFFLQFLSPSHQPRFDPQFVKSDHTKPLSDRRTDWDNQEESLETCALPRFDVTTPRLWAASCGDYNPIHILPLAAVLFGFPSVIAHGNHVVALAVEEAKNDHDHQRFQEAHQILYGHKPFTLEVQFVKPMVLPATFHAAWQPFKTKNGVQMIIIKGDRDCIIGSCYVH